MLAQTYPYWELVFWDNQSSDRSAEICLSCADERIKYFRADRHTDLGAARAAAFEHIRGEFVAVLDTDDVWLPEKLEKQLPCFDDSEVGIVISDTLFFTDEGRSKRLYGRRMPPQGFVFAQLAKSYFVSLETVTMRSSAIRGLSHAFDPAFSHVSDLDLIIRISKDWKLLVVPEVLAKWRVHSSSGTWSEPERFFKERCAFVAKMDNLPDYAEVWSKVRDRFLTRTYLTKALRLLAAGKQGECRKVVMQCPEKNWLLYAIGLTSWLPFSSDAIARFQVRRRLA